SLAVAAGQQPASGAAAQTAPKVVEVEKLRDNLFMLKGGGGNTAVFVRGCGCGGRGYEEPGVGPAVPGQNQGTDAETHHDHHQYAHARIPREWERRISSDRRGHRAREHRSKHAGDASV